MTPDPPPPSSENGKQLPPRHRPTLGNLSQDTTELDLWAFEDDLDTPEAAVPEPQRGTSGVIPSPREPRIAKPREAALKEDSSVEPDGERIKMNVGRGNMKPQSAPLIVPLTPENEFDDLESWDDAPKEANIGELPDEPAPIVLTPEPPAPRPAPLKADEVILSEVKIAPATKDDDEFSPHVRTDAPPLPLRPHLGLSPIERTGMIALLVLLLVGGLFAYFFTIHKLPTESARSGTGDFPIKGAKITVESATSYWRPPIGDGPNPETFRRGTQLLPVLVLKIAEGKGAVRVLFRNEERGSIGDAVTRTIDGAGTIEIPATAGFDEIGMHAAYRTGDSKPWTVEVMEVDAGKDLKSLFEINISTARH